MSRRYAIALALLLAAAIDVNGMSHELTSNGSASRDQGRIPAARLPIHFEMAPVGVECTHCHVSGDWKSDANPNLAVARRMRQMVDRINSTSLNGIGKVTCWTCHEGQAKPRRLPPELWMAERDKTFTGALASQPDDVKIRMSVYAASLSVKCEYCHVPGDWLNASKPAYQMVDTMNAMFKYFPDYMPAGARTQCFMCHKGRTSPRTGLLSSGHDEARPRS